MTPETAILFSERQHFSRWWFLLGAEPLVIVGGLVLAGIVPWLTLLWIAVLTFIAPSMMVLSLLETVVTTDAIRLRFRPMKWRWKVIPFADISKAYIRTYDPLGDFGGWGIKYAGKKEGWCYNAKGKLGLQLEFRNGKRLLIGTQDAVRLKEALRPFLPIT